MAYTKNLPPPHLLINIKPRTYSDVCPFLYLANITSTEQLYATLPTKLRGDIRRQTRRLNEIGTLSLRYYDSFDEATKTFQQFMASHRQKWPKAYKAPNFHKNLLQEGLRTSLVSFSTLDINEKPVAWHLGFQYKERFYYYMPAGNPEYAKFSPVKVHLFHLIDTAIAKNTCVFDHLRGDETYKDGWSNGVKHLYDYHTYSKSKTSQAKRDLLAFRKVVKR